MKNDIKAKNIKDNIKEEVQRWRTYTTRYQVLL